ncbi:MAG: outer membrane beta-barrel protein [Flavobacteriales bacterium]|nr:outer membrane beta-barrel protein [Flavobacteriales bacterium]
MSKKISLLALLFLSTSIFVVAQDKPKSDYRKVVIGIKATSNFSWFKADSRNLEKGGLKLGFGYGLMGDYNFNENYSASFEFLITKLNGKMRFKDSLTYLKEGVAQPKSFDVVYEYSNRYIQIPISIKFRTKEIGYLKYFAQFGLAPAIRITSKAKLTGTRIPFPEDDVKAIKTNDEKDDIYQPVDDDFEKDGVTFMNLPLIIGAGVEYNLSENTSIYACLRFENGFTDILQSKNTVVFSKNIGFSLGLFF